jgi:hypothetical protein
MNPFYYGEMRIKDALHRHMYAPLITRELFERCEDVRLGRTRATATRYSEKPFVFRGLIKCATTGRTVTTDLKKAKYPYLICWDPEAPSKKVFVPERDVFSQVKGVFASIRIPEELLKALLDHLKAGHDAENRFHVDAIASETGIRPSPRAPKHPPRHSDRRKYYAGRVRPKGARVEGSSS